jgi:hypothetical protein
LDIHEVLAQLIETELEMDFSHGIEYELPILGMLYDDRGIDAAEEIRGINRCLLILETLGLDGDVDDVMRDGCRGKEEGDIADQMLSSTVLSPATGHRYRQSSPRARSRWT